MIKIELLPTACMWCDSTLLRGKPIFSCFCFHIELMAFVCALPFCFLHSLFISRLYVHNKRMQMSYCHSNVRYLAMQAHETHLYNFVLQLLTIKLYSYWDQTWSVSQWFFKVLSQAWDPQKNASKKIFKRNFSAHTSSRNFLTKLPKLLLTHHLGFCPKKKFSTNFQISQFFLEFPMLWPSKSARNRFKPYFAKK